jgi:hypothetical protein
MAYAVSAQTVNYSMRSPISGNSESIPAPPLNPDTTTVGAIGNGVAIAVDYALQLGGYRYLGDRQRLIDDIASKTDKGTSKDVMVDGWSATGGFENPQVFDGDVPNLQPRVDSSSPVWQLGPHSIHVEGQKAPENNSSGEIQGPPEAYGPPDPEVADPSHKVIPPGESMTPSQPELPESPNIMSPGYPSADTSLPANTNHSSNDLHGSDVLEVAPGTPIEEPFVNTPENASAEPVSPGNEEPPIKQYDTNPTEPGSMPGKGMSSAPAEVIEVQRPTEPKVVKDDPPVKQYDANPTEPGSMPGKGLGSAPAEVHSQSSEPKSVEPKTTPVEAHEHATKEPSTPPEKSAEPKVTEPKDHWGKADF